MCKKASEHDQEIPQSHTADQHVKSRLYEVKSLLTYDVASRSEITPYNKFDKPLVFYRFTGNVMTSITTLRS